MLFVCHFYDYQNIVLRRRVFILHSRVNLSLELVRNVPQAIKPFEEFVVVSDINTEYCELA